MPERNNPTGNSLSTARGIEAFDRLIDSLANSKDGVKIARTPDPLDVALALDDYRDQVRRKKFARPCRAFTDNLLGLSRIKY